MPSRRIPQRLRKIAPVLRVGAAAGEVVREAVTRTFYGPDGEAGLPAGAECWQGLGLQCRALGHGLARRGRDLLDAGFALDASRAAHRRSIARRNGISRRLYGEMVDVRRDVQRALGRERKLLYLYLPKGSTPRDPEQLLHQSRAVADRLADPQTAPPAAVAGFHHDWSAGAGRLVELADELEQAIRDVARAERDVQIRLRDQRRALADFDRLYLGTARYLEALLELAGLPTLAAEVRPGVGRRGRPRKRALVDAHPDLLARALEILDQADGSEVPVEIREHLAAEDAVRGSREDLSIARKGLPGLQEADSKSEHTVRELQEADRKSERGVRESPAGLQKSEQAVREFQNRPRKSEQTARELAWIDESSAESTVGRKRSRRRKIVLGLGNAGTGRIAAQRAGTRPSVETPPETSQPLGGMREKVSGWWGRLRQAGLRQAA